MPKVIPVLLVALLSFAPRAHADARALNGYGKTTWGMTPDKVLAAESPRAKTMAKPTSFRGGSAGLVTIPLLKISSVSFSAVFVFDAKKKLKRVVLTSTQQRHHSVNVVDFNSLEQLLVEKYGPPTYKTDLPLEAEGNHDVSWKLPKTMIKLSLLYIPRDVTTVTISYRPTASADEETKDL